MKLGTSITLKFLLYFVIFLQALNSFSQNYLAGKVYSAKDSTAVFGASVYFDGTSIGVSTNDDGYFKIPFQKNNAILLITSLGYEPMLINPNAFEPNTQIPDIYLKEKLEELGTVYLENDPWPRSRKLRIFRNEFLGSNYKTLSCKITNEDAIELRFIPSTKTLIAKANEPLQIQNKYFGYLVNYTLKDFEVKFRMSGGLLLPYSTYFEGFSFFDDLKKRVSRRILKNRKQSYLGSSLHFMRSLHSERLEENNFKIFYNRFQVPTYKYFKISKSESMKAIELLVDEIAILYDDTEQSGLKVKGIFKIDYLGNHTPPNAIILSGVMSKKRVSELLPLDFKPAL